MFAPFVVELATASSMPLEGDAISMSIAAQEPPMTDPRHLNQQLLRITRGALDACNQELERIAIASRSPKDHPDWMDPAEIERLERQLQGDKAELEQHLDWLLVSIHFATLRAAGAFEQPRYPARARETLRAAS